MVLKRLLPGRVMDKYCRGELKRALKPHVKENIDNRERLHVRRNIVNINESNLQQVLEQSMTTPVLFYFWSERSQHCLQLTPILESLAAQYGGNLFWRSWTATRSR